MEKLPIKISLPDSFFKDEKKCGYLVTKESKRLWAVLLDLMVQFDTICKEHNIRYALDGGSLLGAVRHQGFIPWDNDMDVIMYRSEYDKFCQIAPLVLEAPYFWQTNETDPGTVRRHGQLRNSLTTDILTSEMQEDLPLFRFNQGVFLDVFILDEVPDDPEELNKYREDLVKGQHMLSDFKYYYWATNASKWMEMGQRLAYREFETILKRYNGTGQKRVANISLLPERPEKTFWPRDLYEDLVDYSFEGYTFPGPRDYDTVLTALYGNWQKYVIGNTHGGVLVDLDKPYTAYTEKTYNFTPKELEELAHPVLSLYRFRYEEWIDRERYNRLKKTLKHADKTVKRVRRKVRILAVALGVVTLAALVELIISLI